MLLKEETSVHREHRTNNYTACQNSLAQSFSDCESFPVFKKSAHNNLEYSDM